MSVNLIVLGAGASRSVSYADEGRIPSPLDRDFRDLLSRLAPAKSKRGLTKDIDRLKTAIDELPNDVQRSMERSFYTLHLRALMARALGASGKVSEADVVRLFARCIEALLREAHGKNVCSKHTGLFERLDSSDAIVTFNYDLVVERALRTRGDRGRFGPWLYGFQAPPPKFALPPVFKLHGSSNWLYRTDALVPDTTSWSGFDSAPGYRAHLSDGTNFPIFLPFWDKRVEDVPWRELWRSAFKRVSQADNVIVWGYSLPHADIKSEEFFKLSAGVRAKNLCVIDPSPAARDRWRSVCPKAAIWAYGDYESFQRSPPIWWR